jgi:hypothetical protein
MSRPPSKGDRESLMKLDKKFERALAGAKARFHLIDMRHD